MSLTYELNGRKDASVSKDDVGLIIGSKARGLKGVISGSWSMYEVLQKKKKHALAEAQKSVDKLTAQMEADECSDKEALEATLAECTTALEEAQGAMEDKPTIRIVLKGHEEGVQVEIISESENMRKLAQLSLDKHIQKIKKTGSLKAHEFLVEFPHRLLGKLIGKKAANLNRLLNDAKFEGSGKGRKLLILEDDLETANTARIQVNQLSFEINEDLLQYSKKGGDSRVFIGWPPEKDDDYEEHISLKITFKHDSQPLKDRSLFIERLNSVISDRVSQIKEEDGDQMDEINECLGFEGY
jgi:hypothetical protein